MSRNNSTRKILLRIFDNYIKSIPKLFFSIICMVIVSATTAINAWMMQPVLDDMGLLNKDESLLIIIPLAIFYLLL